MSLHLRICRTSRKARTCCDVHLTAPILIAESLPSLLAWASIASWQHLEDPVADISRAILAADTVDTHWSERFAPLLVISCIATALVFVAVSFTP